MTETLRVFGARPVTIVFEGWTVFIAVHDANHVRERSAWRLRLAGAHPDRHLHAPALQTRQARKFQNLKARQEIWLRREVAWYAQFELEPPPFGTSTPFRSEGQQVAQGQPKTTTASALIWRLLQDGLEHSAADIQPMVKRSVGVARAIENLRRRGAVITTLRSPAGLKSYRLDTPDGYTGPHQQALPQRLAVVLSDGAAHPTADLRAQLHTSASTLGAAVSRLRKRGAQIFCTSQGGASSYQMGRSAA
jgi:biotin operon repressor